jgi:outer membrane protein TolC
LRYRQFFGALAIVALPAFAATEADRGHRTRGSITASENIAAGVADPQLRTILHEVLDRNPEIDAAEARAEAERLRAPQARTLPDPRAELAVYLQPPETRVGPQRAVARISQTIPGSGKRALREQTALQEAAALEAGVEALRVRLLTEARRAYHEIGYLDAAVKILRSDRLTLAHFEELARARYAAGVGLQQEVVVIQAEMTRLDVRLADLAARRTGWQAELNMLRDRSGVPVKHADRALHRAAVSDWPGLRDLAVTARPELAAVDARIDRAKTGMELARRQGGPDFSLGLMYAYVDRRSDADPPDNGQDVLGVMAGITLPVWRGRVDAAVEEATQRRLSAEALRRASVTGIERELEELRGELPEIERRLELFEGILFTQSMQALRSAEAAYAAGRLDAMALLDAERTLLDVRLSAERSRTDHAIAIARLEGAIAGSLSAAAPSDPDADLSDRRDPGTTGRENRGAS